MARKKNKTAGKKSNLPVILLVAVIVFMIPFIAQFFSGNNSYIGEESYYHIRMIEQFEEHGIQNIDILMNRPYSFNLFHAILGLLGLSTFLGIKLIPILFGLSSLLVLFFIFKELNMDEDNTFFALMILILSPIFIYNSTVFTPDSLAYLLLLLTAYFFIKRNYVSLLFFCGALLTNFTASIALFILMIAYGVADRKREIMLTTHAFVGTGLVILSSFFIGFNPLLEIVPIKPDLTNLLTSFGAVEGYSIITIILAIIGIQCIWERRLKYVLVYSLSIVLFVFSVFYPQIRFVVSTILVGLSGVALYYLINKKWNVEKIKSITLILIICSLLFSSAVFFKNESSMISEKKIDAINYLSATDENNVVLSAENNGFLIESIAKRKAYLDRLSYKQDDYQDRLEIADTIYYSRNLAQLEKILEEKKIYHILIDKDMKNGGIWGVRDEGILFLLQTSKSFVKIFDNEEVQIYRYVGEDIKE